MAGRLRRRISRDRRGVYVLRLPDPERELLTSLVQQMRELLELTTDDPSLRRLFPTAYHDDPDRDREYQQLARDELLEARLAALDIVESSAMRKELTDDELSGWLTALNDLRLVLGTRLDVSEDLVDIDADDPDAPALAVYGYLGMLLDEAVQALAEDLPPPTEPEM